MDMDPEYELAHSTTTMPLDEPAEASLHDEALHRRTLRKLDFLLLPFLALLFLFNSLDKTNIGNAESAHFTKDIGLRAEDLNTAVALFFVFFVTLQPAGAALGRRYGMVPWVPTCMLLWGIATALHVWLRARWQLYVLRIAIGCLEAGFYPVTVSYLSLFYTRFEFGRRLSLFYGQAAVGGALGGILSAIVFSQFPHHESEQGGGKEAPIVRTDGHPEVDTQWRSWQVLFLFEGCLTIVVAIAGYFWLPHSAATAWFFSPKERVYATNRVIRDRHLQTLTDSSEIIPEDADPDHDYTEETRSLLGPAKLFSQPAKLGSVTEDRGITPHDIVSAFFSPKIWHLLACNILSAIPVYAFQVFLPIVLAPYTTNPHITPNPVVVNLLTAPPYVCGATALYLFARYSDHHHLRIKPILVGLAVFIVGLSFVVMLPSQSLWVLPRYIALNVLFAGTFIASPLTVAWISGNTPSAGKRALLLGINGWGNLAGIFSALLFQPKYAADGYLVPFWWTLVCVGLSAVGYVLFYLNLKREAEWRKRVLSTWDPEDVEKENVGGNGPVLTDYRVLSWIIAGLKRMPRGLWAAEWLEGAVQGGREGDEKITFVYGV